MHKGLDYALFLIFLICWCTIIKMCVFYFSLPSWVTLPSVVHSLIYVPPNGGNQSKILNYRHMCISSVLECRPKRKMFWDVVFKLESKIFARGKLVYVFIPVLEYRRKRKIFWAVILRLIKMSRFQKKHSCVNNPKKFFFLNSICPYHCK